MEPCIIITNNPMAAEKYADRGEVIYLADANYREVLVAVRDKVYLGHQLINHPLYGSLRPHETPYRTVALTAKAAPQPDADMCMIMSDAFTVVDRFVLPVAAVMSEKIRNDYQMIDCDLLKRTLTE